MRRSAADVIRHLQARVARLEGRTASNGMFYVQMGEGIEPVVQKSLMKFDAFKFFGDGVNNAVVRAVQSQFEKESRVDLDHDADIEFKSIQVGTWNSFSGSGEFRSGGLLKLEIDCVITPSGGVPTDFRTEVSIGIASAVKDIKGRRVD